MPLSPGHGLVKVMPDNDYDFGKADLIVSPSGSDFLNDLHGESALHPAVRRSPQGAKMAERTAESTVCARSPRRPSPGRWRMNAFPLLRIASPPYCDDVTVRGIEGATRRNARKQFAEKLAG